MTITEITAGEYGGREMIVWDARTYTRIDHDRAVHFTIVSAP